MGEQLSVQVLNKDDARRRIKRLEVEHDEILEASQTIIGEATNRLAADNPDLLIRKVREVQEEQEQEECEKYWSDEEYEQATRGER